MRSLKFSETEGQKLHDLSVLHAQAVNPHIFFDGKDWDAPQPERLATINKIKAEISDMLDGGIFRDLINRL